MVPTFSTMKMPAQWPLAYGLSLAYGKDVEAPGRNTTLNWVMGTGLLKLSSKKSKVPKLREHRLGDTNRTLPSEVSIA